MFNTRISLPPYVYAAFGKDQINDAFGNSDSLTVNLSFFAVIGFALFDSDNNDLSDGLVISFGGPSIDSSSKILINHYFDETTSGAAQVILRQLYLPMQHSLAGHLHFL